MCDDYDDPAHEADMRQLKREQLHADISPEEANAECMWGGHDMDDMHGMDEDEDEDEGQPWETMSNDEFAEYLDEQNRLAGVSPEQYAARMVEILAEVPSYV
jgi:hypothetical protein